MTSGFSEIVKSGNGNTLIITALLAAVIANAIPTPADGLYFSYQQKLKEKLNKEEITPKQFWTRNIAYHYIFEASWYILVILFILAVDAKFENNIKLLLLIIGGGIVIGVWKKNIEKDEKLLASKKLNGTIAS